MADNTMLKGAIIDASGQYRYSLWRIWDSNLPGVLFIMLNPSTADATIDDPTIRRCIGFAKSWGYGSLEVVNLFAYRATNPDELKNCIDPVGSENDEYILKALKQAKKVITAWGTKGAFFNRNQAVMEILKPYHPHCLDTSKGGHPKHPLYISADCVPFKYLGGA
ncbi:DUF1643 domain-containing protein [Paenibacillus taichungensis]